MIQEKILEVPQPKPIELVECILGFNLKLREMDARSEEYRRVKAQSEGLRTRLARQLHDTEGDWHPKAIEHWIVTPIWRVEGVPRKVDREEARRWLKDRGIDWDGSAPPLRHAMRGALQLGEVIPAGGFGLFISLTVRITDNWTKIRTEMADDPDLDLDDEEIQN